MDDMMWFLLGLMNGKGGKVKPLSVTENGTYNVSDVEKAEGYVGYCPVTVDVPDRYQEGYDKGHDDGVKSVAISPLTVTANGTYSAADYSCNGFDPVNVNVPDRYQEGYEDGQEHGKYTFPDGTSYSDVVNIIGGDAVADEKIVNWVYRSEQRKHTGKICIQPKPLFMIYREIHYQHCEVGDLPIVSCQHGECLK